jgi:hypothetical protein
MASRGVGLCLFVFFLGAMSDFGSDRSFIGM